MTPPLFLSFSVSFRIPSNRFYSGFAISRTGFRHPYLFVCIETDSFDLNQFFSKGFDVLFVGFESNEHVELHAEFAAATPAARRARTNQIFWSLRLAPKRGEDPDSIAFLIRKV